MRFLALVLAVFSLASCRSTQSQVSDANTSYNYRDPQMMAFADWNGATGVISGDVNISPWSMTNMSEVKDVTAHMYWATAPDMRMDLPAFLSVPARRAIPYYLEDMRVPVGATHIIIFFEGISADESYYGNRRNFVYPIVDMTYNVTEPTARTSARSVTVSDLDLDPREYQLRIEVGRAPQEVAGKTQYKLYFSADGKTKAQQPFAVLQANGQNQMYAFTSGQDHESTRLTGGVYKYVLVETIQPNDLKAGKVKTAIRSTEIKDKT